MNRMRLSRVACRVMYPVAALLMTVASILVVVAVPQPAAAQGAEIPSGYECETQPAGLLDVLGMLNDVDGAQYANRVSSIGRTSIAPGKPLDKEDSTAIAWTVRQVVACANALDPLRVLPLLSRNFQASLVANVVSVGDLGGVLDDLPLVTSDTIDKGGAPALTVINAWYDADSSKRVWAEVSMPVPQKDGAASATSFLVSFVYDEYFWVVDSVWSIQ